MSSDHEKAPPVEDTELGAASVSQRKRVIHFANGDVLEQDSSDEEESAPLNAPFSATDDTAQLSWREYSWFLWMKAGKKSLQTCDFMGEKLAKLVGLNTAKYQYAIDEHQRGKTEESRPSGTDGAPCVEEGSKIIQLPPQKSSEYGATSSLQVPGPRASLFSAEDRTTGSHNQGYQEE